MVRLKAAKRLAFVFLMAAVLVGVRTKLFAWDSISCPEGCTCGAFTDDAGNSAYGIDCSLVEDCESVMDCSDFNLYQCTDWCSGDDEGNGVAWRTSCDPDVCQAECDCSTHPIFD